MYIVNNFVWSMFSLVWVLFVLKVITANQIEIWEAVLTLLFFVFIYFNRKFINYFVNDNKNFINLDLSLDSLQLKSTFANENFCEITFDNYQYSQVLKKKVNWLFKVHLMFLIEVIFYFNYYFN
jgi:hypothetical protein